MPDPSIATPSIVSVNYDPRDWYWVADSGRIYSSARNGYVGANDPAYLAFVARIGGATAWPKDVLGRQTTASLAAVLQPYGIIPTMT